MTLSEAGRRLGITVDRVRGMVDALEIQLTQIGRALCMSEADFQKLKRAAERAFRKRKPEPAASA